MRLAFALLLAAAPALAHDTWFQPWGAEVLSLGTGTRYPAQQFPVGAEQLVAQGCRDAAGQPVPLVAVRNTRSALLMHAAPQSALCWGQLQPFEIELPAATVAIYLDEIAAPPHVRAAWAGMQARGVPWKERFTKHARIALQPQGAGQPVPLGLDILRLGGQHEPVRPGRAEAFQVLRDGRPLPAQALELVGPNGASAGWFTSDDQGRIEVLVPGPGRWILRGTDLRLAQDPPDTWDSRFVTLSFAVEP